jgi:hypothetical protein
MLSKIHTNNNNMYIRIMTELTIKSNSQSPLFRYKKFCTPARIQTQEFIADDKAVLYEKQSDRIWN